MATSADSATTVIEKDSDDEGIDDERERFDLPVSMDSCLLLNATYQDALTEFREYLESRLRVNRLHQEDLKSSNSECNNDAVYGVNHPNSLIPFMAPYFKDVKGISAPLNEDAETKRRNGEINQAYLYPGKPWNKKEKMALFDQVCAFTLRKRTEPLLSEREKMLHQPKEEIQTPEDQIQDISEQLTDMSKHKLSENIPEKNDSDIDWLAIAHSLDTRHDAQDCELMWNNSLHPSINNSSWQSSEDEKLKELVRKHGKHNWDLVAKELGTNRLAWQCCARYQSKLNPEMKRTGPLLKEEAETVENVIASCRIGDYIPWHQVAYFVEGRSLPQIKHYWNKINVPKRGESWTDMEDKVLKAAVKKYGDKNWRKVAYYLPGRSNRQCRERYMMRLNFDDRKLGDWTPEEDRELLKLAKELDYKWVQIEKRMNGRNARQIASRFDNLMKWHKDEGKPVTRTLKLNLNPKHRNLVNRVKKMLNPKKDEQVEDILRKGRQILATQLDNSLKGLPIQIKGRPKKSDSEEDVDKEITELFGYYNLYQTTNKSVNSKYLLNLLTFA